MSDKRTRRYRDRMAAAQRHRCYYCQFPMWLDQAEAFAAAYDITLPQANRFRCTAEHLKALGEGGTSCVANIVAACRFCNERRHRRGKRLAPETFMAHVQARVAKHSWHPPDLHRLVATA